MCLKEVTNKFSLPDYKIQEAWKVWDARCGLPYLPFYGAVQTMTTDAWFLARGKNVLLGQNYDWAMLQNPEMNYYTTGFHVFHTLDYAKTYVSLLIGWDIRDAHALSISKVKVMGKSVAGTDCRIPVQVMDWMMVTQEDWENRCGVDAKADNAKCGEIKS